jgi:hypothetical protein
MEREVEINRFKAKSEDGKEYTIIEYQEEHDVTSMPSEYREWLPGLKRLATSDGLAVNYIDSETFKIVSTDEIIRKV